MVSALKTAGGVTLRPPRKKLGAAECGSGPHLGAEKCTLVVGRGGPFFRKSRLSKKSGPPKRADPPDLRNRPNSDPWALWWAFWVHFTVGLAVKWHIYLGAIDNVNIPTEG